MPLARKLGKPKTKKPPAMIKVKPYKPKAAAPAKPKAEDKLKATNPVKKTDSGPTVADKVKSKMPSNLAKAKAAAAKKRLEKS